MNSLIVLCVASLIAVASARSFNYFEFENVFEDERIVNGEKAELGQFPHQVSLRLKSINRHFCGGTILNSRWILTAAHCSFPPYQPIAVAGSIELRQGGKAYNISKIIPHPGYIHGKLKFDIALWRTKEEIEFNENVQPATLPTENTPAEAALTVSGWGRTSYPPPPGSDGIPNRLQYLNTTSIGVDDCKKVFKGIPQIYFGNDFDKLVCVLKKNAGACHGDSGGPLITEDRTVVGVVSWGIPCAKGYPDGFTRVHSFLDFIKENLEIEYDD